MEQIGALKDLVTREPLSAEKAAQRFRGARRELVTRHLETLALMGEVYRSPNGVYSFRSAAA